MDRSIQTTGEQAFTELAGTSSLRESTGRSTVEWTIVQLSLPGLNIEAQSRFIPVAGFYTNVADVSGIGKIKPDRA
jgi:hypothetical protein